MSNHLEDTNPNERDPTKRFTDRVADYVRHRPGYPRAVIECLVGEFGLRPHHVVADVGSGTGILTKMLLDNGNCVMAVEPNEAMRAAAERELAGCTGFTSVAGSAEATGLAPASVDWITAAQAFHWFDVDKSRAEFQRILRRGPVGSEVVGHEASPPAACGGPDANAHPGGGGLVALIWNDRKRDTPFLQAYEDFLHEFGTDFKSIRHEQAETDGRLERFFGRSILGRPGYARRSFDNEQVVDQSGLRGRTLSASYMPGPGHSRHEAMLQALDNLFATHQKAGRMTLAYETHLYVGVLG